MPHIEIPVRQAVTIAALCIGAALFPARDTAAAGPPLPFNTFTVDEGVISAGCPTFGGVQAVCGPGLLDDGMLQREIHIESGPRAGSYIQFIITEPGVSGDAGADPFSSARGSLGFVNEDFIRLGNRGDGIASLQTMIESEFIEPTRENRFVNVMEYEFGWANSAAFPWVDMYQEIAELDYSVDPGAPTAAFHTTVGITSDASGFNNHLDIEISQTVDLSDALHDGAQKFRFEKAAGFYQLTTRAADGTLLPGGTNGGDIDWGLGEMLTGLWIGQTLDNRDFGYTTYRNLDQGTSTAVVSLADPEAVNWVVPPFSPVESMGHVQAFAPTANVAPPVPLQPTIPATVPSTDPTVAVALPVAYDEWTVSNGVVVPDACPAGVTCGPAIVNEGGLFQRTLLADGVEYIQTIVTDAGATGDPRVDDFTPGSLPFKSESLVRRGAEGLASSLHIAERDLNYMTQPPGALPSSGGEFAYTASHRTGWANGGPLDPTFMVEQRIAIPDENHLHASSLEEVFRMQQGASSADRAVHISSVVGTRAGGGSGYLDPIMFYTSMVQGEFQTATRTPDPFDPLLPATGGDIAWDPGDAIRAVWIGGDYITPAPSGRSTVGTTSYYNLSTGDHVSATSLETPHPASWVDPFEPPDLEYTNLYTP